MLFNWLWARRTTLLTASVVSPLNRLPSCIHTMSDSLSAAVQQLQPAPVQHFRPYKIDLLTGATNWYQWRNLQVQVLRTMGLYDHISSDTSAAPPPATAAAALATWNLRDSAACTQLMLHIASSQLRNADNDNNDKTARQVWVKLCNVYTDTSMAAQMALQAELSSLTQQPGVSIQDHSNQLLQIADRLRACGVTLTDPQLCGYFLSSLSEPYSAAVDMFKLMPVANPLSYEQVLTAFLSKEAEIKRKGVEAARSASSIAAHLASITADAGVQLHLAHSGGQKRKALTCTHCDKRNHEAKDCWQLHPELRESGMQMLAARRNKRQARENGSAVSHHLTYTSSRPTSTPTVRVMNAHVLREVAKAVVDPMGTRPARTQLRQVAEAVMDPMGTRPARALSGTTGVQGPPMYSNTEIREWYLDSGASHHVCGQRAAMTAYESTAAVPVLAAGGETLYALGVGSVSAWLSSTPTGRDRHRTAVVLSDVMYVPGLRSNLISVTALLKAGNQVVFTGTAAHIQDASGTTWATATLRHGETLFSFWLTPRPTA